MVNDAASDGSFQTFNEESFQEGDESFEDGAVINLN